MRLTRELAEGPVKLTETHPANRHRAPRRIAVIGNAGAGKSTLARALAQHLGLRYIDRDATSGGTPRRVQ